MNKINFKLFQKVDRTQFELLLIDFKSKDFFCLVNKVYFFTSGTRKLIEHKYMELSNSLEYQIIFEILSSIPDSCSQLKMMYLECLQI